MAPRAGIVLGLLVSAFLPAAVPAEEVPGRLLLDIEGPGDWNGWFGSAVAGGGDVNGDGRADFAVGAPGDGPTGIVYVYSGLDGSLLYTIANPPVTTAIPSYLGNDLAFVDDVTGDNRPDLLVADKYADVIAPPDTLVLRGAAFLFSGATGALVAEYHGAYDEYYFATSLAVAGDVTGDGVPEFLFGTPAANDFAGAARVMTLAGDTVHLVVGDGVTVKDLGRDVAGVGDVDGDGRDDFAVGAPGGAPPGVGWAFVYSGRTGAVLQMKGGTHRFGRAVGGIGDVDGDGRPDYAMGTDTGLDSVFVYSGATGNLIFGREVGWNGVLSLAGADLDADQKPDVIAGWWGSNAGGDYYFTSVLSGLDGTRLMPDYPVGGSVSALGDIDGDGRPEWIGGDPSTLPSPSGRIRVYGIPPTLPAPGPCSATGNLVQRVEFTWANVTGESGFRVYRDGALRATNAADDTTYSESAGAGTFRYCVRALNEGGAGDSCCALGTSLVPPPPAPTYCAASDTGGSSVYLWWTDVYGEDGFRITRDGVLRGQTGPDLTTFTDPAGPGTYLYCVRAFNSTGESDPACDAGIVVAVPPPPAGFAAGDSSPASILLTWTDAAQESGYRITREGLLIASPAKNATSYEDRPPPGTYAYCITAFNAAGESSPACDAGTRLPFGGCPRIMIHLRTPVVKNPCSLATSLTDCANAAVQGEVGPSYYAYVVVADYDSDRGLAGVQFGVDYDRGEGIGVDIFGWASCGNLQFPGPGGGGGSAGGADLGGGHVFTMLSQPCAPWYACDSGNIVTWNRVANCRRDAVTPAGYFYVSAYSDDELRIVPRYGDGMARIADCAGEATTLAHTGMPAPFTLGSAGFGGAPGSNPCLYAIETPSTCETVQQDATVLFSWNDVADEEGYYIYRDGAFLASLPPDSLVLVDAPAPGPHTYAVEAFAACATSERCSTSVSVTSAPGGEPAPAYPAIALAANPARAPLGIRYYLSAPGPVRIRVYAIRGELLATVLDGERGAGWHRTGWDGRDARGVSVPRGIYLLRLDTPGEARTVKALLLR